MKGEMMTLKLTLAGVAHIHTPGLIKCMNERPDVSARYVWDPEPEGAAGRDWVELP
jgi:hypothetical protein